MRAQLIFGWKTAAALVDNRPWNAFPNVLLRVSDSHKCAEETHLEFFSWFDERIGADRRWIMVLDGYVVHKSATAQHSKRRIQC